MSSNPWDETRDAWDGFLQNVREARSSVGTTYAGSWFRGQVADWPLLPSLFRATAKIEAETARLKEQKADLEKSLRGARRYARKLGIESDDRIKELEFTCQRIDERIRQNLSRLPDSKIGAVHGEGRAFVEYRFRSGASHHSSWQTLAEMQHYRIPTRLLDWSESFVYALAFALASYVSALQKQWSRERQHSLDLAANRRLTFHDPSELFPKEVPKPVLWILNPYRLSDQATGHPLLWDFTLREADDYYQAFIANRSGPQTPRFVKPVPMLTPWRDERIAAQKGVFTCFGSRVEPLERMINERVLQKIPISPLTAVHGVRFLHEIGGIDEFTMFRDRDSLGKKTSREFFPELSDDADGCQLSEDSIECTSRSPSPRLA
jgi:FRG domain